MVWEWEVGWQLFFFEKWKTKLIKQNWPKNGIFDSNLSDLAQKADLKTMLVGLGFLPSPSLKLKSMSQKAPHLKQLNTTLD